MQNKESRNRNTGLVIVRENIRSDSEAMKGIHYKGRTGKETEFVTSPPS